MKKLFLTWFFILVLAGRVFSQASVAGDVSGPGSSTDNTIPRFNGTSGSLIQGSGITISDSNLMSGVSNLIVTGTGTVNILSLNGKTVTATSIDNFNAVYGWGNHSAQNYLDKDTDTYVETESDPVYINDPAYTIDALSIETWNSATGTPGGNNTQVQFNDNGSFGGDSRFAFNKSTGTVYFGDDVYIGSLTSQVLSVDNAGKIIGTSISGAGAESDPIFIASDASNIDVTSLDKITASITSVASDSTWTLHNSYPSACSAGQYVSGIGDTLTCSTPAGGSGSGTILSGTAGQFAFYSGTGTVIMGASTITFTAGVTSIDSDLVVTSNGSFRASEINDTIVVDGITYPQTGVGIQAAINALPATGGKVLLPIGTYVVASTITIPSRTDVNIEIAGEGPATVLSCTMTNASACLYFSGPSTAYDSRGKGLYIHDFKMVGNASSGHGLHIGNTQWSIIRNLWLTGFGLDGLYSSWGLTHGVIHGVLSYNNTRHGFNLYNSHDAVISNCYASDNDGVGFYTYGNSDVMMEGVVSTYNTTGQLYINQTHPASTFGASTDYEVSPFSIYVTNGDFSGEIGSNYGVKIENSMYITFSNNLVTDHATNGISLTNVHMSTISNNRLTHNDPYGIVLVNSSENIIQGNHLVTNGLDGTTGGDIIQIDSYSEDNQFSDNGFQNDNIILMNPLRISDLEAAWTASANVTTGTDTSLKKFTVGEAVPYMRVASAFTTGLIAYYNLPATKDLSGEDKIGFWMRTRQTVATGVLALLLDDSAGCASPVETITINEAFVAGVWRKIVLNLANPASDSAIASIGLSALSDPGEIDIYIDGMTAGVPSILTDASAKTVTSDGSYTMPSLTVDTEVYGAGWNGDNTVPTKDAVYDKVEALVLTGGGGSGIVTSSSQGELAWYAGTGTVVIGNPTVTFASGVLTVPGISADGITVDTVAYDATSWNGNYTVPTKDAIRDKIETIGGGSQTPWTSNIDGANYALTGVGGISAGTGTFSTINSTTGSVAFGSPLSVGTGTFSTVTVSGTGTTTFGSAVYISGTVTIEFNSKRYTFNPSTGTFSL